jgi:hypothetical protein
MGPTGRVTRGEFFKTAVGANFARRRQLKQRANLSLGANFSVGAKICLKKLPSDSFVKTMPNFFVKYNAN